MGHIAAAHVEVKHQSGHWGFDGDTGKKNFSLTNVSVEDADLVEIGLDFLTQASLSVALIRLTSCVQADQLLFFRIEVGANLCHLGQRRHHLQLAAGTIPLQLLITLSHHLGRRQGLPQSGHAYPAAADGGSFSRSIAVVVLGVG